MPWPLRPEANPPGPSAAVGCLAEETTSYQRRWLNPGLGDRVRPRGEMQIRGCPKGVEGIENQALHRPKDKAVAWFVSRY